MDNVADLIGKYGFPIVSAAGMGYFIYFVWKWVTTVIKPVISQANGTLIALIDRIRMLDNDLIRLNQKVETVLQLRGKTIDKERILAEQDINEDPFKKRREEEAAKREAEKKQLESEKSIGGAKGRKATAEEIKNASGD
jgi:hypothetical protein